MSKFVDPIDEIIARHNGETESAASVEETEDTSVIEPVRSVPETPVEEVNYGDDDLEEEIAAQEKAEAEAKAAAAKAAAEKAAEEKPMEAPPLSLDPEFQREAIDFQTNNIAIVTTMVNKVIAKHHIVSGGIPANKQRQVMGELIFLYQKDGEVITPEFERMILDNWEGATTSEEAKADAPAEEKKEEVEEERSAPVVNINVPENTPVTINIDESIMMEQSKDRVVNIVVHEVSEEDLRTADVIENSADTSIITPYESSKTDVPLTLAMSAYRCTVSGLVFMELLQMSSISNGNDRDTQRKMWSLIYKHIRNVSIGDFETFEDFLKATSFTDLMTLFWGTYVATAGEEETIQVTCGNEKCKHPIKLTYKPREIIHVDEKLIPDFYNTTHTVPAGEAARKHWKAVRGKHRLMELPDSKVVVEFSDNSAYDMLTTIEDRIDKLWARFRPDDPDRSSRLRDAELEEFNALYAIAVAVKSISINKNGKTYRFSDWDDILKIVSESISNQDFVLLLNIISDRGMLQSPMSFSIEVGTCPKCGYEHQPLNAERSMRALFFQLSQPLVNTTINYIETPKN